MNSKIIDSRIIIVKKRTVDNPLFLIFMFKLLLLLAALFSSQNAYSQQDNEATQLIDFSVSNKAIVKQMIEPNYQHLMYSASALQQEISNLCFKNDHQQATSIAKVKERYISLRIDWAKAQLIQFGPINYLERKERFDFWPDKHRVGERQLRRLLSEPETQPQNLDELQKKSVALQGVSAIERLIFSQKDNGFDEAQCKLAMLISSNLSEIATEVFEQWSKEPILFSNDLINTQSGVTFFQSETDVATALFNAMMTQLNIVKALKIENALPKKGKKVGNRRNLESWRTQTSFTLMVTNLETVQQFYTIGFSHMLQQLSAEIDVELQQQFSLIIENAKDLEHQVRQSNLDKMMKNEAFLKSLNDLRDAIQVVEKTMTSQVLPILGLNLKFNSLDGD